MPASSAIKLTAYLKLPDIEGESKLSDHEGEIDIHRVHWRIAQGSSASLGSGLTSARAEVWPIYLDKWCDASSPYLALVAMQGKTMEEGVLMFRKDSGDAYIDYLQITMTNLIISSYEMLNEYTFPEEPLLRIPERVGISFEKVKVLYTVQASEDGMAGDEHEVEYDIVAGAT